VTFYINTEPFQVICNSCGQETSSHPDNFLVASFYPQAPTCLCSVKGPLQWLARFYGCENLAMKPEVRANELKKRSHPSYITTRKPKQMKNLQLFFAAKII